MNRMEILNYFIKKNNFISYLEIGVCSGECFSGVDCENKTGVDPAPKNFKNSDVFIMTSDLFFETLDKDDKYDLIFIDGLHLEEQVDKDIENSLLHLSSNGLIVLHDVNPKSKYSAREDYDDWSTPAGRGWNGTAYKSIIKLRCNNPDVYVYTIDTPDDESCGVLNPRKKQDIFDDVSCGDLLNDFDLFFSNKQKILNLISVEDFKTMED